MGSQKNRRGEGAATLLECGQRDAAVMEGTLQTLNSFPVRSTL